MHFITRKKYIASEELRVRAPSIHGALKYTKYIHYYYILPSTKCDQIYFTFSTYYVLVLEFEQNNKSNVTECVSDFQFFKDLTTKERSRLNKDLADVGKMSNFHKIGDFEVIVLYIEVTLVIGQ